MYQFFSALVSQILSPHNWVILLVILFFIFRKKIFAKKLLWAAAIVFLVFTNPFLYNSTLNKFLPKPVAANSLKTYSCGIVPGGFGSPHKYADGYFNMAADRFLQAVKLYHMGKIEQILITGGNGKTKDNNFNEAAWAKQQMAYFGVPDSVVITDDRAQNTKENAIFAKEIIVQKKLLPPYLLITSASHLPRAKALFDKAGLPTDIFPCNYTTGMGYTSFADLFPSLPVMDSWQFLIKEWLGKKLAEKGW